MFGKKKEKESYQMKETYKANDLVIANLRKTSRTVTEFGPIVETTEQKYIFEVIRDNTPKYQEVFTGFIANTESEYFNLPYVVNVVSFTDFFPETVGVIFPKFSLIWLQNDINHPKKRKKLSKDLYSR